MARRQPSYIPHIPMLSACSAVLRVRPARPAAVCARLFASAPPATSSSSSSVSKVGASAIAGLQPSAAPMASEHLESYRFLNHVSHTPKNSLDYIPKGMTTSSSGQDMIMEIAPIEVDGWTAICDGGDPHMGHPTIYMQLNKTDPTKPETCKYCGLRFISKHANHHYRGH